MADGFQFAQMLDPKAFEKDLARLDRKVRKKVVRRAITKASTPIVREARKKAPVGPTRNLKRSMGRRVKLYEDGMNGVAVIGPRWPKGAHGIIVHEGTGERFRKSRANLGVIAVEFGRASGSTGRMPPNPFLRQAFNSQRRKADAIIAKEIKLGLERGK